MAFGLGVLKLPPAAFWGMTLQELAATMRAMVPDQPRRMDQGSLDALIRRYPDE